MYVALGGAGGKVTRRDHGESGVKPKQTDWGERMESLSQTLGASIMHGHYVAWGHLGII